MVPAMIARTSICGWHLASKFNVTIPPKLPKMHGRWHPAEVQHRPRGPEVRDAQETTQHDVPANHGRARPFRWLPVFCTRRIGRRPIEVPNADGTAS